MALIVHAVNVTGDGKLSREDGSADYEIWVGINHHCIFRGNVKNHLRTDKAAKLLRLIADEMEKS